MTTAAIYCRISDDRVGDAAGVGRQEADCRALCDTRGWAIGQVFTDNDVSAYSGRRRPAWETMLNAVKQGEVDAVVVWHLDRLTRRPIELERFFEVCDAAGVKKFGTCFGDVDLSSHDGQFLARILGAAARKESDDKSRRTRRKHLELAQRGAAVGGGRPFGYEADRVTLRPTEAGFVLEAVGRALAGESLRSIVADWNARSIPAVKAGAWTQTSLRRVLVSPRIAGLRAHGRLGPVVAKGMWPAIVDEATHHALVAVLRDPARRVNPGFGARVHLLTGLLFCERCGKRLIMRGHGRRKPSYVCTSDPGVGGCGGIRVTAGGLEAFVVDEALRTLDGPDLAVELARSTGDAGEDPVAELAAVEVKLAELAGAWATDDISKGEWLAARQALEARAAAARRRLLTATRRRALDDLAGRGRELRETWGDLAFGRKRAVLEAVVERVMVGPALERGANRFDTRRVSINWRA